MQTCGEAYRSVRVDHPLHSSNHTSYIYLSYHRGRRFGGNFIDVANQTKDGIPNEIITKVAAPTETMATCGTVNPKRRWQPGKRPLIFERYVVFRLR